MQDASQAPRRSRPRLRWTAGLLGLVTLLALAYLAIHWLLNTAWLQSRLTPQPGLVISWEQARSGWPGTLRVEGLEIRRDDAALPLRLTVESATLELSLPALLGRRLQIRSLDARGLRTLELGGHRLAGDGRLALSGLELAERRLGIERLQLALEEARVARDGLPLAEAVALSADLSLAPFVPREHPGAAALRFLSGELHLEARADAWDLFNPYLREIDWLALGGHGHLATRLLLTNGELMPGSELTLDSPALRVDLDEAALLAEPDTAPETLAWSRPEGRFRLVGAGRVTARVTETAQDAAGELSVRLEDLEMREESRPDTPFLTAPGFRLEARLPTDLARPPRRLEAASLHWEDAEVPDIAVLSRYLPGSLPLQLAGGRAALNGRLEAASEGIVTGDFALRGEELALRLLGEPVTGELALDLRVVELDPAARRLDLSGTRLVVDAGNRAEATPLHLALDLDEARLSSRVPLDQLAEAPAPLPLDGRLRLRGRVDRLGFLDAFLADALAGRGLGLEGSGRLEARLGLAAGRPTPGSHLAIDGEALAVRLPAVTATGRGRLEGEWRERQGVPALWLQARLEKAGVVRRQDAARLLQDADLTLEAEGRAPGLAEPPTLETLQLTWRDATLPDMAVLNAYLPSPAPFRLDGGSAASHGALRLTDDRLAGALQLSGRAIAGTLFDEAVEGELTLDLALRDARLDGSRLDLSGTRLALEAGAAQADERLGTLLVARQAQFTQPRDPQRRRGRLVLDGRVDRLGFLDAFLPREHGLALRGRGLLTADLRLAGDALLPESRLDVDADALAVRFLDYQAEGRGQLNAWLEGTDAAPGARLRLGLPRFALARLDAASGAATTWLQGRHLSLETATPAFRLDAEDLDIADVTTRVTLPIVEVPDLALYNAYLPEGAGLELLAGRASLDAELLLEGPHARGDLTLHAFGATLRLADQRLTGDLTLATRLRDGDLAERRFDASGSQLRLDNVSRTDAGGGAERGWWARLTLEEGRLIWTQPLVVESRLALAMRDSGLLARLFLADARERDWLGRLLTVRDIQGEARLRLGESGLQLSEMRLAGGRLTLLADLLFNETGRTGSLYARLGSLGVGVSLEEDETRIRLLRPRRWFEQRAPGLPDEELIEVPPEAWREAWRQEAGDRADD